MSPVGQRSKITFTPEDFPSNSKRRKTHFRHIFHEIHMNRNISITDYQICEEEEEKIVQNATLLGRERSMHRNNETERTSSCSGRDAMPPKSPEAFRSMILMVKIQLPTATCVGCISFQLPQQLIRHEHIRVQKFDILSKCRLLLL